MHPLQYQTTKSKKRKFIIADSVGWIGATMMIVAYSLMSFNIISSNGYLYILLNIFGAVGMIIFGVIRKAHPSVATNTIWLAVAFISIINTVIK